MMYLQMCGSVIRAAMVAVGATGTMSDDQVTALAGAMLTIASVAWSLWEKRSAHKELRRAQGW